MPPKPGFDRSRWRRASYSLASGECVTVASSDLPGYIGVRDSKNPDGSVIVYSSDEWKSFVSQLRFNGR